MSNLFLLTGAQMARLQPFCPKSHGKPWVDDRRCTKVFLFAVARAATVMFLL